MCRSMWSDTASYQFHSPGDVQKRINKDAYNMEGPNLSNHKFRPMESAGSVASKTKGRTASS
jgi:hypothetical protein